LETLEFAYTVSKNLATDTDLAASDVFSRLIELRQQASDAQETLQRVTDEGTNLNASGFSSNEKDLIWSRIRQLFGDTTTPPSAEAAAGMRQAEARTAESKRLELAVCRQTLDLVRHSIRNVCGSVDMHGWHSLAPAINSVASLTTIREELATVLHRLDQLRLLMDVRDDAPLTEIQVSVSAVASAFQQAQAAMVNESANSEELRRLPETIAEHKSELEKAKSGSLALGTAVDTLDDIIVNASLETATADALAAIGGQINEVFTRIHAPREYEYVGSREVLLRTANSHEPHTLEEVSTGQRAAFALSIFLARNRTAATAPPVLLIDDPIAHIDDLNALSFLDYLRDLAVNSGRQIFFATADTRIASLFSKKFSFFGDNFKTINLVRMPEPSAIAAD